MIASALDQLPHQDVRTKASAWPSPADCRFLCVRFYKLAFLCDTSQVQTVQILFFCWWMFPLSAACTKHSGIELQALRQAKQVLKAAPHSFLHSCAPSSSRQRPDPLPYPAKQRAFHQMPLSGVLVLIWVTFLHDALAPGLRLVSKLQLCSVQTVPYRAALLGFRALPQLCNRKSLRFLCPIFPSVAGRTWVEEKISLSHGDRSLICSRQASLYNQTFLALCSAAYYGKGMLLGIAEDSYKEQGRSEWEGSRVW